MTSAQTAAFLFARSVAALAEIEAMKAANEFRRRNDYSDAYGEDAFFGIHAAYRLGEEDIRSLFAESEGAGSSSSSRQRGAPVTLSVRNLIPVPTGGTQ